MQYLLVFSLCFLATLKVTCQSTFAKKGVKTLSDSVFFNAAFFIVSALIFSPYLFEAELGMLPYAAAFATSTVLFQLTYTKALSEGNVSIAVMLVNFGMIFPVLISCFVFGEEPSAARIAGIALTLLAFFVSAKPGKKGTKRAFVFSVIAMFANGAIQSVQRVYGATEYASKNFSFTSLSYLISALLAIAVYAFLASRGNKKTFKVSRLMVLSAIGTGLSLGVFLALKTYAITQIDGTYLFPAYSGGSIILSTVMGIFCFRDKLSARQIAALVLGTVSIVLMEF